MKPKVIPPPPKAKPKGGRKLKELPANAFQENSQASEIKQKGSHENSQAEEAADVEKKESEQSFHKMSRVPPPMKKRTTPPARKIPVIKQEP